ncbi:MAG: DegV family protein [Erysipelotrichaceae bacterium]
MNKVALVCDSSADISKEEAAELGVHVIRMPVIVDGVEYVDQETISTQELVHHLSLNHKVTTTQPSPGQFLACWDELLETYDQVLYYPLSKNLSGTCASAMQLAQEYEGRVVVIDSTFVCQPLVVMLKWAKDLLNQGKSAQEIKTLFETQGELYALLIPKTLTTLRAGGRISAAAAALGGLLKIQPILTVENGAIDVFDKVRTLKKAYHVAAKHIQEVDDPSHYVWMVIHLNNEENALHIKAELEQQTGQPVLLTQFMAVISAHTGDGTIGIGRIKKVNLQ